ncbi:MAG: molybdenum ABC transporter ATP-binding protein [Pseudomonadota bacterium]|nr:molybdenum ABC transporter ATP-binding protein [Pseudomonadota bacterium]
MQLSIKVEWRREQFLLNVAEQFEMTGVTALFGRSGCGKTSLLRVIAGLDRVRGAEVLLGESVWQQGSTFKPTERRRVGLVFQEHSLLPHLDVTANLLYGYKRTRPEHRRQHPEQVFSRLELEPLLGRRIDQLSGGQRQRVSLGRALLTSPDLLLLDEPLAALDTQSKRDILPFLLDVTRDSKVPVVLVTHSPDEVQRLADRVVFMDQGRVTRTLAIEQAMADPASPLFADEGPASILRGTLDEADASGLRTFKTDNISLLVRAGSARSGEARVRVLARDVSVALDDPGRISIRNQLRATIVASTPIADQQQLLTAQLEDGQALQIEVTAWSAERLGLNVGTEIWALVKSVALME